jgi:beta-glucosidase-like glycosyl hydrolase
MMPRLDAERWGDTGYRDAAFRLVDEGVGGFGVFKGTLEQTAMMLQELQLRSGNRLVIGADFEYGLPMRLTEGGVAMPRAMALGKGTPEQTEQAAAAVAREASALGVHWNWAPVADINSNPLNPIVNVRAFGETPDVVSDHVAAWVRGSQREHVMACVKHAPGHGATVVDSHVDLPTIEVSAERASRREFAPFRAGIEAGVGSVMMGHLLVPFLDRKMPASVSRSVVTGLVREGWGFNGLIVTDALDMGAITKRFSSGEAALRAVKAGNDVVLLPEDPLAAIDELAKAVHKGTITEARLVASEERWNQVRMEIRKAPKPRLVDLGEHAVFALRAAFRAVELRGSSAVLPVTQYRHAAVFSVVSEHEAETATQWLQFLTQATEIDIDVGYVDGTISDEDLTALQDGVSGAEMFVFVLFGAAASSRSRLPGFDRVPEITRRLASGRPTVVVSCGSPYGIDAIAANTTLLAYSDTTPSLAATVLMLVGKRPPEAM